MQSCEQNLNSN